MGLRHSAPRTSSRSSRGSSVVSDTVHKEVLDEVRKLSLENRALRAEMERLRLGIEERDHQLRPDLPEELWGHVLTFVDDKYLWRLGAVCRAWRAEVDRLRPEVHVVTECLKDGGLPRMCKIRRVKLWCYSVEGVDMTALGGVHTLDLSYCSGVEDVSALAGVHTLNLSNCINVTDVSALGRVCHLTLSGCEKITDVSALGGVEELNLGGCFRITDVSSLGRVRTLKLSGCYALKDVSALGGVHTLKLSECHNVTDVSALGGVHTLDLSYCNGITDVSSLTGVQRLDLRGIGREITPKQLPHRGPVGVLMVGSSHDRREVIFGGGTARSSLGVMTYYEDGDEVSRPPDLDSVPTVVLSRVSEEF